MSCATCALTINKYLDKQGAQNIKVNFATGDVLFEIPPSETTQKLVAGIESLGYQVKDENNGALSMPRAKGARLTHLQRFWICFPFTLVLMLHMLPGVHIEWLMNPWLQLALCLPVYIVGMSFYGKSAWHSLRNGMPNMNVLIAIGATAAFGYSLVGTIGKLGPGFMFYETAATIITLVFLGNYIEDATVSYTQSQLNALVKSQKVMANMIAFDDKYQEQIFPIESEHLKTGDLILIKTGEQIPADCKILWGEGQVSEAIITGESEPLFKTAKDLLIGGSMLLEGTIKAQVTAAGKDTVLANILDLAKQAQGEKPPVQQMADKISAVFVPAVLVIAILTVLINWIVLKEFTPSLIRGIAVLVIACPCAMGLATPAAIAVGLGRGARNGVLFRNAKSLELFKNINQVVFDKTGTLTTGNFTISKYHIVGEMDDLPAVQQKQSPTDSATVDDADTAFRRLVYSIEKYSNHPIAQSISRVWKTKTEIRWSSLEEIKGFGMKAVDQEGNTYLAVSYKMAAELTRDDSHNVYIIRNNQLLGWIDVKDELRPESKEVVHYLHQKGIKTILLSGDLQSKATALATELGIDTVIAEQTPAQKLEKIAALTAAEPTAMVGDGMNDAPALAKATIGISMSDASQIAMQTASVVLMNKGIKNLPMALGLGKQTYKTIKENLYWAFSYNIIAIPVAALGFLGQYGPTYGALLMGVSDVILIINSARLAIKRVH